MWKRMGDAREAGAEERSTGCRSDEGRGQDKVEGPQVLGTGMGGQEAGANAGPGSALTR